MAYLFTLLKTLRSDEKGATAIEYGLIAALIAVAAIVGMGFIGDGLGDIFAGIGNELDDAVDDSDLDTNDPE